MSSRTSHTERTASQPRQNALHSVRLAHVQPVNSRVRLLKLALPYAISVRTMRHPVCPFSNGSEQIVELLGGTAIHGLPVFSH
jgi:hypothetical protein